MGDLLADAAAKIGEIQDKMEAQYANQNQSLVDPVRIRAELDLNMQRVMLACVEGGMNPLQPSYPRP